MPQISRVLIDLRTEKGVVATQKRLRRTRDEISDSNKILKKISRTVERKYMRPMMAELRKTPPSRSYPDEYPIQFTSDAQRKYVMMLLNGGPYDRTGNLPRGWFYRMRVRRSRFLSIKVANKYPESRYVVGDIGSGISQRAIRRYQKPIQAFHLKTGWKPAYEPVGKAIRLAKEEARDILQKWAVNAFTNN